MNKNNSLIKIPKSFFGKIVSFFKKTFWKGRKRLLENKNQDLNEKNNISENIEKNDNIEDEIFFDEYELYDYGITTEDIIFENNEMCNSEEEKNKFFQIYDNIKSKKVDVKDIDIIDLFKASIILKEEEKLKEAKIKGQ